MQDTKRHASNVLMIVAALILMVSLFGSGLAFVNRFSIADQRRDEQKKVNAAVATAVLQNCQEIERIKAHFRQEAIDNFKNLDRNLKLLHLKKTPHIVNVAKSDRDKKLRNWKEESCPRPVKKIAGKPKTRP